jgi:anti-sigma factor RsiW
MKSHPSQEQLIDYLHRELAPGEDAALLLHLESCASCSQRYQDEASLSESLRGFARASERELPAGVRASIWSAIESSQRTPTWSDRLRSWLRPVVAIPVAAAFVVVALTGYESSLHRGGPTIDAAYYLDDHAALTSAVPFNEGTIVPTALFATENADGAQ